MHRILRSPFLCVTLLDGLLLALTLGLYGTTIERAQTFTRLTARVSLIVFAIVFTASAWQRLRPSAWSALLLKGRRRWGVAFAYAHTIHLAAIFTFLHVSGQRLELGGSRLVPLLAYVLTYLLAATSNDAAVRSLGARNWKRLHRVGVWYLWTVFLLTYIARLTPGYGQYSRSQMAEFVVALFFVLALAGIRLAAYVKGKARTRTQALEVA